MSETPRPETLRELQLLARQVIELTQKRGVPIIEKVIGGRVFSWPITGFRESVAERLDKLKDNVAESERIQKIAYKVGALGANAAVTRDAIIEALPFEFGIIKDLPEEEIKESGNVGITFRGVRYQVTLATEESTSETEVFEIDDGGVTEDDVELQELVVGLQTIVNRSISDDQPPAA